MEIKIGSWIMAKKEKPDANGEIYSNHYQMIVELRSLDAIRYKHGKSIAQNEIALRRFIEVVKGRLLIGILLPDSNYLVPCRVVAIPEKDFFS